MIFHQRCILIRKSVIQNVFCTQLLSSTNYKTHYTTIFFWTIESYVLLATPWFIYYQGYMCRLKNLILSARSSHVPSFLCPMQSKINLSIFEHPCFAPEWKCFIFFETFKRLPHSKCPPSAYVTLSAYVKSLSTPIWKSSVEASQVLPVEAPLSVDTSLSVEALAVDECLSVEALYPLRLWVIRWGLWFYPLKANSLISWYYFITKLQGIEYLHLTFLSCISS